MQVTLSSHRPFAGLRGLLISGLLLACSGLSQAAEVTGLVYPLHDLILSAGVSGVVLTRNVAPGQSVVANQLLLSLDDRMQVLEVERRKVILDDRSELKTEKDRLEILQHLLDNSQRVFDSTGAISQDELMRLKADYVSSKGKYEQLLAQKQREEVEFRAAEKDRVMRHIYAPVAGVVTKISLESGEWAKQGDPMIHLVDAGTCVIRFAVPLANSAGIHVGTVLPVTLLEDSAKKPLQGKVSFISPIADPASGMIEAKITFSNATLKVTPGIKAVITLTPQ